LKPIEGKKPLTDRDLVTVPSIYSDGEPRHEASWLRVRPGARSGPWPDYG